MSLELSEKDLAAIRAEFCKGFTQEQFDVAMTFCRLRNLLPGKHVLFQLRRSKEWDEMVGAKVEVTKIVFITTIDASRLIAQRTGQYGGQAPEQYIYLDENGAPTIVSDIPLPRLPLVPGQTPLPREPWAVKTTLYRKDFDHPVISVARFDAYASTYKSANGPVLTEMWTKRGPEQLAKCSEMLSLRRGWPEELGGVYLDLELKNENEEAPVTPASVIVPASVVPLPPVVPPVNQTPAIGTDSPRPGENIPPEIAAQVRAAIPAIEKIAASPEVQKQLAAEGKKIDQDAIEQLKKDFDLTTAAEIEAPKKRGRKPKSPDNGQVRDDGITDADIATAGTPAPVDDPNNAKEAQEFVESVTSFTKEEAAAQGLPEPPDPLPSKEESAAFVARARKLVEPGVDIKSLGDYTLGLGNKTSSKYLTVGDWTKALTNLEAAKTAGTLKQLVKGEEKPLGTF